MKQLTLLFALLLVTSIFSTSFALAEGSSEQGLAKKKGPSVGGTSDGPTNSVYAEEITKGEIQTADIDNSLEDLEALGNDYKQVGFPLFRSFTGALKDANSAYLAHIGLVEVKLLASDNSQVTVALGRLKVADNEYKLVATKLNTQAFVLYVLPMDAKLTSLKDVSENSIGTFTFSTREQHGELHLYAGSLKLTEGDFVGSWNGDFWSDSHTLRKKVASEKVNTAKVATDTTRDTTEKSVESGKSVPAQKANAFARFWSRIFGQKGVKTVAPTQAA